MSVFLLNESSVSIRQQRRRRVKEEGKSSRELVRRWNRDISTAQEEQIGKLLLNACDTEKEELTIKRKNNDFSCGRELKGG